LPLLKAYAHQKIFLKLLMSFLFVGIFPLLLAWFAYYAISSRIILQDTGNKTFESAKFVSLHLDRMILENSNIINAIESNEAFNKIFELGDDELLDEKDITSLYNIIYILLAGKIPKAGIYVMNASGSTILSTKPVPADYDPVKFHNWGVFRKSNSERGRTIIYSHKIEKHSRINRVLSVSRAVFSQDSIVGYIIIDLYQEHFAETLTTPNNPGKLNIHIFDNNLLPIFSLTEQPKKEVLHKVTKDVHTETRSFTLFEEGQKQFLFSSYQSKKTGLYIVGVQPLDQLINVTRSLLLPFLMLGITTSVVCFFLAFFIARSFSRPLYEVIKCVKQVERGNFSVRTSVVRKDEFLILGNSVNAMIQKIQELISDIEQKERSLRVSEMKALQAQIHPHLIFNCLEMIKWNIRLNNPEEASHIVIQLAKLLRRGIDSKEEMVKVNEELALVEIYLDIQKHRFEDKLATEINVDSKTRKALIPKYIIQPIVENSIIHGLKKTTDKGIIIINGYGVGQDIFFEISDNGTGIEEQTIKKILSGDIIYDKYSSGTGMQNVMKRIKLYYGKDYGLSIESVPAGGTKIILRMKNNSEI